MSEELKQISDKLDSLRDSIQKRVDILISLQLRNQLKNKKTTTREQIAFLSSLGLKYDEIANVFGKSAGYIASELTHLKKKSKKKAKEESKDMESQNRGEEENEY